MQISQRYPYLIARFPLGKRVSTVRDAVLLSVVWAQLLRFPLSEATFRREHSRPPPTTKPHTLGSLSHARRIMSLVSDAITQYRGGGDGRRNQLTQLEEQHEVGRST